MVIGITWLTLPEKKKKTKNKTGSNTESWTSAFKIFHVISCFISRKAIGILKWVFKPF
jgi:hypothetical protein